jgi:hypothetical protein
MNRKTIAGGVLLASSVMTLASLSNYLAPTLSYERTTNPTIVSPVDPSPPVAVQIKSFPLSATLLQAPHANLALATFSDSNINILPNLASFLQSLNTYLESQKAQAPSGDVQSQINALQRQISLTNVAPSVTYTTNSSPSLLSTSNLPEGSNLYYTDGRVANHIDSSSTIPTASGGSFGNVLSWNGSRWASLATSSLGISGSGTVTSITTGSGLTGGTISAAGTIALDQSAANVWTAASSTFTNHISLNTASSSVFTATTLCLNGDTCRSTWPTGGSGAWAWNVATNFGATTNATTTPTWYQTGLYASSTSQFANATTSLASFSGSIWFTSLGTPAGAFLAVDSNGKLIATSTPAVGGGGTVTNVATDATLTGGPITTTGTFGLNLGNSNWWTTRQNFTQASTSQFTATSTVWFTGLTNALLSTDSNGMLVATTSVGVYASGVNRRRFGIFPGADVHAAAASAS